MADILTSVCLKGPPLHVPPIGIVLIWYCQVVLVMLLDRTRQIDSNGGVTSLLLTTCGCTLNNYTFFIPVIPTVMVAHLTIYNGSRRMKWCNGNNGYTNKITLGGGCGGRRQRVYPGITVMGRCDV